MRRFFPTFLLIILVLALYPFIGMDENDKPEIKGLPWQIETQPDGYTRVFGLVPGKSTLSQAVEQLGDDYELAIVKDETSRNLEMYYSHYRAGLMTAKLVLTAQADDQTLAAWQQRAAKIDYMKSGKARKYILSEQDRMQAMQSLISVITFIPAVNLDDEIIRNRFGEPDELIEQSAGVKHYLYAGTGLGIALSEQGKEVLQYVAPVDFDRLRAPLTE